MPSVLTVFWYLASIVMAGDVLTVELRCYGRGGRSNRLQILEAVTR